MWGQDRTEETDRSRKHAEEEGWQNDPARPKYEGEANLVFS